MIAIDIHTHIVPEHFPPSIEHAIDIPWPSMHHDGCGHANVMISGRNFRTVSEAAWNPHKRLEDINAMGIGRQVLSPMPELLSYWIPAKDAADLLRHINEQVAVMAASDPERLIGFGAVPLQDVDLAIRELEFAAKHLGLAGVEIGSNINGVAIGDPQFEPFFAAVESLGVGVFVHALRPDKTRLIGPPILEQTFGFPCEVAYALGSMITAGTLAAHPKLRIAFSHGGGAFALVLARMEHVWNVNLQLRETILESPRSYARKVYYDSCVFDGDTLRYIADAFGDDRLLIGTDYPFAGGEKDPIGLLKRAGFADGIIDKILHQNAERFLGLVPRPRPRSGLTPE